MILRHTVTRKLSVSLCRAFSCLPSSQTIYTFNSALDSTNRSLLRRCVPFSSWGQYWCQSTRPSIQQSTLGRDQPLLRWQRKHTSNLFWRGIGIRCSQKRCPAMYHRQDAHCKSGAPTVDHQWISRRQRRERAHSGCTVVSVP
jgi:hypothetical protein